MSVCFIDFQGDRLLVQLLSFVVKYVGIESVSRAAMQKDKYKTACIAHTITERL